jgi:hypothetical protein
MTTITNATTKGKKTKVACDTITGERQCLCMELLSKTREPKKGTSERELGVLASSLAYNLGYLVGRNGADIG